MEIFFASFIFSFVVILLQAWDRSMLAPSKYFAWILYCPHLIGAIAIFFSTGDGFDLQTFTIASVFMTLFGIFYWIGYRTPFYLNYFNFVLPKSINLSTKKNNLLTSVFIVISVSIFGALVIITGFNPITNPLEFRIASTHYYGSIALFMSSSSYLAVYYSMLVKDEGFICNKLFWISLVTALGLILVSGSRSSLIQMVMLWGIYREVYLGKKINFRLIAISLILFVIYSIFYNVYRMTGSLNADREALAYYSSEIFLRFDTIFNFLKVVDATNSGYIEFLNGSSIMSTIQIFIPRIIWSDKPLMISRQLHEYFSDLPSMSGLGVLSEQSSAYYMAEAFLNFKLIGAMIYGLVQGGIIRSFDNYYDNAKKNNSVANVFASIYLLSANNLDFPMEGFSAMRFPLFVSHVAIIWLISIFSKNKKNISLQKC
jgi:hypothetical protein